MSTTIRKQKSGEQLTVGDWLAPEVLLEGAAEVLFAYTYPAGADSSLDKDGTHVQLVVRELGKVGTWTEVVSGANLFDLASDEDLAEYREAAARAEKIADLRKLANWLEERPWLPIPDLHSNQHVYGLDGYRQVCELAERPGGELDTHLDDRTIAKFREGPLHYSVIAWHQDGRPAEPEPELVTPAPVAEHYETTGWTGGDSGSGVACACGVQFDGFDSLKEAGDQLRLHIEVETSPAGLTKAADESRGVLAGTSPVVAYFSFGHGQTDPDTGKKLINHYVTVVAPTYEACREAMFASRFGRAWSFDYLAGTKRATEWIPRWTEHEVIVAPGTDPGLADSALAAAMLVLDPEPVSKSR